MESAIDITMLGKFVIDGPGLPRPRVVSLGSRARRLWMLTAYLILHRDRGVPAQELMDWLWPQAQGANQMTTLQNNISRARSALEELGLENGRRLICNNAGTYFWAPDRTTLLDCEIFENQCVEALREGSLEKGLEAARAYGGPFLPECQGEPWREERHRHYEELYRKLLTALVPRLLEAGRYPDAEALCKAAQAHDPGNQLWLSYRMRALRRAGKPREALNVLEEYAPAFESLSAEVTLEREEVLGASGRAPDDSRLLSDWAGKIGGEIGAMRCDKGVFREFVCRQLRDLRRGGEAQVLSLRTQAEAPEALTRAMDRMEEVLTRSLRGGDPFTRGGDGLFLLLLSSASRENGEMVANRILTRYNDNRPAPLPPFTCQVMDLNDLSPASL